MLGAPARRATLRITNQASAGLVKDAAVNGDLFPDGVEEGSRALAWTPRPCVGMVHLVYPLRWLPDEEPFGR